MATIGEMTVLASGFDTLEGPAFDRYGNLFFVDWVRHSIMRRSSEGELREFYNTGGVPAGLAFHPDGSLWVADEGDDLFRDVGEELAHQYKPMRTYLDRGVRVAATSDIPSTVHYNPFVGLYSLVTRKTWKGTPIAPQEAVTREEALSAYTLAGAWLTREEGVKGPIAPGFLADMAVLDRDYFSCPEEEIKDIKVVETVKEGQTIYRAS